MPTVAFAASADTSGDVLTESVVVQQALQRYPSVLAARQRADSTRLRSTAGPGVAAPVLKVGAVDGLIDSTTGTATQRRAIAGLEWAPPQPGELDAKRALARAQAEEAQALADAEDMNVALKARSAFRRSLVLRERLLLLGEAESLQTKLASAEADLPRARTTSAVDPRPPGEGRPLQPALEWETTIAHLAHLIQEPKLLELPAKDVAMSGSSIELATKLIEAGNIPLNEVIASAVANRPEVKAANARCAALEAQSVLRSTEGRLSLKDVGVTYSTGRDQRTQAVGLMVGINLPLGRAHTPEMAVVDRKACSAEQASVVAAIRHQVTQEHLKRKTAVRDVQESVLYGIPAQERFARNMRALWNDRRVDEARLLRTELRRVSHHLRALDSIDDLLQSDALLRAAAGETDAVAAKP